MSDMIRTAPVDRSTRTAPETPFPRMRGLGIVMAFTPATASEIKAVEAAEEAISRNPAAGNNGRPLTR